MSLRQAAEYFNFRGNTRTTDAAIEPVDYTELATHLRLTDNHDDEYLQDTITMARQWLEEQTGMALIDQTWLLTLDQWPGYREPWWDGVVQMPTTELYQNSRARPIIFPRFPLSSVTSITVYSDDGTASAVTVADIFDIDVNSKQGRMTLQRGATWPIATQSNNAIEIVYVAGWGSTVTSVPPPLRRAVLEMAAYLYTHRGDCTPETAFVRSGAGLIMQPYKIRRI